MKEKILLFQISFEKVDDALKMSSDSCHDWRDRETETEHTIWLTKCVGEVQYRHTPVITSEHLWKK